MVTVITSCWQTVSLLLLLQIFNRANAKICGTIEVRNYPRYLNQLEDCSVIEGNLKILLIENAQDYEFESFSFPQLVEVTGYLWIYRVDGLTTLSKLFPNLRVIRGRELLYNYALIIWEANSMQDIGLPSLTHIDRGLVRIEKNAQLCYLHTIAWTRIVRYAKLDKAENYGIIRRNKDRAVCINQCPAECDQILINNVLQQTCWNINHCQKVCVDNDSENGGCIEDFGRVQSGRRCDSSCLGGCNVTATNCFVCKDIKLKNGTCSARCPKNKLRYLDRRCITEAECRAKGKEKCEWKILDKNQTLNGTERECQPECPPGFMQDEEDVFRCRKCDGVCPKVCESITIDSIAAAEKRGGCTIIRGNLEIMISAATGNVMHELENSLGSLTEVTGSIKITRSYPLMSLQFLRSLRRIGGDNQYQSMYSFYVLDNENLRSIWDMDRHPKLHIDKGKLFFHSNRRLCVEHIQELAKEARPGLLKELDERDVSLSSNGDQESCQHQILNLTIVKVLSTMAVLNFTSYNTNDKRNLIGYVISFRETLGETVTYYTSRDACDSGNLWKTKTSDNPGTEHQFVAEFLTPLKPFTEYAVYVEAQTISDQGALSKIVYFKTAASKPTEVFDLQVKATASDELHVFWEAPLYPNGKVTEYKVMWHATPINPEKYELRNYCENQLDTRLTNDEDTRTPSDKDQNKTCTVSQTNKSDSGQSDHVTDLRGEIWFEDWLINSAYTPRQESVTSLARSRRSVDEKEEMNNLYHMQRETMLKHLKSQEDLYAAHRKVIRQQMKGLEPSQRAALQEAMDALEHNLQLMHDTTHTKLNELEDTRTAQQRSGVTRSHAVHEVYPSYMSGDLLPEVQVLDRTRRDLANISHSSFHEYAKILNNSNELINNYTSQIPEFNFSDSDDVHREHAWVETKFIILPNLTHFQDYFIEVVACHDPENNTGGMTRTCSSKAMVSGRTLPDRSADVVDPRTITVKNGTHTKDNHTVFVGWSEPPHPNGVVLLYRLTYKNKNEISKCVPRKEYRQAGNGTYLMNLIPGNWSLRISVTSLAGPNSDLTSEVFFYIPDDPVDLAAQKLVIGLVLAAVVLILMVAASVSYYFVRRKGHLPNGALYVSVNENYLNTHDMYIPDNWEVEREEIKLGVEIGSGSFGKVFLGEVKHCGKLDWSGKVAVKMTQHNASIKERIDFLQEASVMKQFETIHVVQLVGVVSQGQPALVIMEYMANGDLKNFLRKLRPDYEEPPGEKGEAARLPVRRPPPTFMQLMQMAAEIADGMYYLHTLQFLHRDLAARNCMVSEDMSIKVGDFGMAREIYQTDYYRKEGKGMLPVRWMPPESLKDGVYTNQSDVWAYGVVLWEMATLAEQPYQGMSNDDTLKHVLAGNIMAKPPGCAPELYKIMCQCWKYRNNRRPTFADLLEDFEPYVSLRFKQVAYYFSDKNASLREEIAEHRREKRAKLEAEDAQGDSPDVVPGTRASYNGWGAGSPETKRSPERSWTEKVPIQDPDGPAVLTLSDGGEGDMEEDEEEGDMCNECLLQQNRHHDSNRSSLSYEPQPPSPTPASRPSVHFSDNDPTIMGTPQIQRNGVHRPSLDMQPLPPHATPEPVLSPGGHSLDSKGSSKSSTGSNGRNGLSNGHIPHYGVNICNA